MQQGQFPDFRSGQERVAVRLYCDEIKPYRNRAGEQWMYMGILSIPGNKYRAALDCLHADRQEAHYPGEVHFRKLSNRSTGIRHHEKTLLARRWVERVMVDAEKVFHFHLLGLHLDYLQEKTFGARGREQRQNIYNRFFRAALTYNIKTFFGAGNITVTHIFHDQSSELQHSNFFDWHAVWRIDQAEDGIHFRTRQIRFIDSDHRKETKHPDDSHFIQLCDVLLGAFTHALDDRTTKNGCTEIADCLLPLVERLVDPRRVSNCNSRYHYYRRLSLSFFPSTRLSLAQLNDPLQRSRSAFYIARQPLLSQRRGGQLRLFD